ncbi:putative Demethylmenaquinone methyltransferase [Venustampulla echinocandica]|uniref:Putative Demethylmenaquinone methyltransferase n=1 Tax=Venustampulla echinocandica TaxID=2656787 RepID=A0A370TJ35_9HELO|nr:putative Demethylmenaquinone methyltransferase [Venustampulla echinocandica]RDL35374.1 putative Demethylmenaquinone methyltransferase [Venustampulla echinocandica]
MSTNPPLAVDQHDDGGHEDAAMRNRETSEGWHDGSSEHAYSPYAAARTVFRHPRGDNDTMNSTQSLYDSDIVYINIHGRRYCKNYYMPNDEEEQVRSQMLHSVYFHLFDQKLTMVPLTNPRKILDIGTGTGDWAMAMGDEYPEAEVIGTDIAKIQPSAVPLNVYFEIDDAEEEGGWTWPKDEFDLIHFRAMLGAFKDWRYIYSETYQHLKPGGWVEVFDFDDHQTLMTHFDKELEIDKFLAAIAEATRIGGRPRSYTHLEPKFLAELGFVDISTSTTMIPMGSWSDDPGERQAGKHFLVAQLCGLEALCLRPLTEVLGWDPEEVRRICGIIATGVKAMALDHEKAKGLGFNVRVLVGRKPFPDELPASSPSTPRASTTGDTMGGG